MPLYNQIVWQPRGLESGSDFDILLNRSFAEAMFSTPLSPDSQRRFNEIGREKVNRNNDLLTEYRFHGQTAFIRGIYLRAGGVWLAISGQSGMVPNFKDTHPLIYSSHNVTGYQDIHDLLTLFENWVSYADTFRELSKAPS